MRLAMPGSALRAQPQHPTGQSSAAAENPAAWLSAAWAATAPDVRHTRRVALLKRALPASGLALLLLIAMWPRLAPLWERMRLGFPAIDLRDARQLRMINPRYAGVDRLGRPFVVTAAVGRQMPDRQDLMSLEAPRADLKTHSGADVVVTAATGIYQSQAQLLDLFGDVTLVHQNGTRFVTAAARVDVATNAVEGTDPVVGHGPSGDVKAQGFRVLDKGDTVIFTGPSDMLLRHARPGTEKSVPAGLPAPVAAAAARTAAAAKPVLAAATPSHAARGQAARPQARAHAGPRRAGPHHAGKPVSRARPAALKKS
jgi:lipopolysaccharide export system protein LptC